MDPPPDITATVLRHIEVLLKEASGEDASVFWAIATSAFFGFFRLGELLVESDSTYNPSIHLS